MTDSQDYHRDEIFALAWIARRIKRMKEVPPIDPKLSDGGAGQDACTAGSAGAGSMTSVAVRCSAWLGDVRWNEKDMALLRALKLADEAKEYSRLEIADVFC